MWFEALVDCVGLGVVDFWILGVAEDGLVKCERALWIVAVVTGYGCFSLTLVQMKTVFMSLSTLPSQELTFSAIAANEPWIVSMVLSQKF